MCARQSFEAVALGAALGLALLSGCASPGPPQPPSLKLPEVVTGLAASRVGDAVLLQWTTPSRTTDKLLIAGPIEAEICRETLAAAAPTTAAKAGQSAAFGATLGARKSAVLSPCSPVLLRERVTPGVSEEVDPLPAELTSGPAQLLAYRVQLRNAAGHTAGASAAVFAASGPAPQAIGQLRGRATKAGAVLEWRAEAGGADAIELERTILEPPSATANSMTPSKTVAMAPAATAAGPGSERNGGLPGAAKEPLESRFRAGGAADEGGTVDRTVQIGHTYRYTAQRVRHVELGGQRRLEVRCVPSAEVTVVMQNVFPPEAPAGLVAVPGFTGQMSAGQTPGQNAGPTGGEQATTQIQRPAIDLSWEPDLEPRIAGYRVYRRDLDGEDASAWRRLDSELVPVAAYRDLSVVAGRRYAYRVTAVSEAGNESAPSEEVVETAPAQ